MRTFAVLGSARVAVGRPGQAWHCPALTRSNDAMLRTCLNGKLLFGIFIPCWVPLPFGYCKWEIFSFYSLGFFFLPIICFCGSFLPDGVLFARCDQRLGSPVVCVTMLLGFFSPLK